ncbi:hypothetical protein AW25_1085 [Francisella tularensis subsp. novicida U112]|nr:hypothetical protein AW25_1085 [Francisella tularensis subsp. novicida U112]
MNHKLKTDKNQIRYTGLDYHIKTKWSKPELYCLNTTGGNRVLQGKPTAAQAESTTQTYTKVAGPS